VVVLEPSCAAVFRPDLPELLFGNEAPHRSAGQTYTIGEVSGLKSPESQPPPLLADALVQPRCHQHAILRYTHEWQLLDYAGISATVLDVGNCGLAGNLGFENGHYDLRRMRRRQAAARRCASCW
jgi:hypothetical protein